MVLEGRVALVTGSGRGIGRACALCLAKLGADVVINDINLKSAQEFQEELTADTVMDEVRALGRRSIGIDVDVTNKQAVKSMFDAILKEFGHIDILVNNVGGAHSKGGPLVGGSADITEEDFRFIIDLNLVGTVFCCQVAIPHMVKQGWGRIVNISSLQGLMIRPVDEMSFAARTGYSVAKAGVIQYTRLLASELGPYGIRVNCISPGPIATARHMTYAKRGLLLSEEKMRDCPLGRSGLPEDIAKTVEFLCTDLSDYVTGQCIRVDGGKTLF